MCVVLLSACPKTGNRPDAGVVDAAPLPPPPPPSHLLLTEVYSQIAMYEFIEVYNPTSSAVSLDDYYLADDALYALLPRLAEPGAPTLSISDFIARFPAGASIAPGQVIVVARDGVGFASFFTEAPDFALNAPGGVAAMRRPHVGADAQLADPGELVALFQWDGVADLVTDVDLVLAGSPQGSNGGADKTGTTVDGPDGDSIASAYLDDAATLPSFDDVTSDAHSYKRIALEGHDEVFELGNGITGHDETSEQTRTTWGQAATFVAPTPGAIEF